MTMTPSLPTLFDGEGAVVTPNYGLWSTQTCCLCIGLKKG